MGCSGLRLRLWPWIVLSAILVGAFYFESYLDSTILYYYVGVGIILLVVIVCWAWIRSGNHMEERFKDSFHKCFNSYLACFVLTVLLATLVSYLGGMVWNIVLLDGARTFFLSSRWDDIISGVIIAPLEEEIIYRLLPFIVASIPVLFVKTKIWRLVIAVISLLMITCVQLQFGYAHYSPIFEEPEWIVNHIIFQGSMGVVDAITYGLILFLSYNTITGNQRQTVLVKPLAISHVLAYLASSLTHGFTNLSIIINQTF